MCAPRGFGGREECCTSRPRCLSAKASCRNGTRNCPVTVPGVITCRFPRTPEAHDRSPVVRLCAVCFGLVGEPPDRGAQVGGHPGQLVDRGAGLGERLRGGVGSG